jgi:hypothetical protein
MSVSLLRAGPECIADSPDETVTHPMYDIFKQTMKIEIDNRFSTKLNVITDAPEPLRGALLESLPSGKAYAPSTAIEGADKI